MIFNKTYFEAKAVSQKHGNSIFITDTEIHLKTFYISLTFDSSLFYYQPLIVQPDRFDGLQFRTWLSFLEGIFLSYVD